MLAKIFILICALAAVLAYPYADEEYLNPHERQIPGPPLYRRVRRQLQLQGGGGGSPKQGFDLNINGRVPVWQSPNGRHQFDAMGGYAQHLGGPFGNSRPQYNVGAGYTFRF